MEKSACMASQYKTNLATIEAARGAVAAQNGNSRAAAFPGTYVGSRIVDSIEYFTSNPAQIKTMIDDAGSCAAHGSTRAIVGFGKREVQCILTDTEVRVSVGESALFIWTGEPLISVHAPSLPAPRLYCGF